LFQSLGKGGKNRRRGKNENETEKRELVFKEDGQGNNFVDKIYSVRSYCIDDMYYLQNDL